MPERAHVVGLCFFVRLVPIFGLRPGLRFHFEFRNTMPAKHSVFPPCLLTATPLLPGFNLGG